VTCHHLHHCHSLVRYIVPNVLYGRRLARSLSLHLSSILVVTVMTVVKGHKISAFLSSLPVGLLVTLVPTERIYCVDYRSTAIV
jgi:hypothetical protein